jgi:hypothetical protein
MQPKPTAETFNPVLPNSRVFNSPSGHGRQSNVVAIFSCPFQVNGWNVSPDIAHILLVTGVISFSRGLVVRAHTVSWILKSTVYDV